MNSTLIERIYRRILKESGAPSTEGMACYVESTGDEAGLLNATVYNTKGIEKELKNNPGLFKTGLSIVKYRPLMDHIIGCVSIKDTADPCLGAYEISTIAGRGKLVYGLAYALSPNGMIISDRYSMSPEALGAWKNMADKGTRSRKPLDNVKNPRTEDPSDDCTWRKEEYLNYAYESEGWEKGMLSSLRAAHKNFVITLDVPQKDFENVITIAGGLFFDYSY